MPEQQNILSTFRRGFRKPVLAHCFDRSDCSADDMWSIIDGQYRIRGIEVAIEKLEIAMEKFLGFIPDYAFEF